MLEQNREGARHSGSRVAVDEASGPEACSRDESLEWARPKARTKLLRMLDLVRTETVSDTAFSESPPSIRNEAAAFGLKLHENRRV